MNRCSTHEFLTILRTADPRYRACKRLQWISGPNQWKRADYRAGMRFTFYLRPISNLNDLSELLEKIRTDRRSFIVRGAPTAEVEGLIGKNPDIKLRRIKKLYGKLQPTLREVPLSWLMLDIDNLPLPDTADLTDDPEGAIDHAIHTLLPIEFHNVRCWWQLSSTAGINPGILKAHLFFWLSEPKTNAELKQYFSSIPGRIDTSVFNATQPIYVADPIIEGRPDWLPRRTGWREGLEEDVCLPEVRIRSHLPKRSQMSSGEYSLLSANVDIILDRIGDEDGQKGFYIPTRDAAFRYALETPICQRDDDAFKIKARAAIVTAVNRDPARHHPDDVAVACSDERLDGFLNSAFEKLGPDAGKWSPTNFLLTPSWHEFSLDEARERLTAEVHAFMERAIAFHQKAVEFDIDGAPAEIAALAVDVGVGKTHTTIRALKDFIDRMKDLGLPYRVLYLVPTHRLGSEILESFVSAGIDAATFRGREADDLENSDGTKSQLTMCLDLAAVKDARQLGLDPERAACGTATSEWRCSHFFNCSYQKQKEAAANADVVVVAHAFLFRTAPQFLTKKVGIIITDESFWQSGIETRFLKVASFGVNLNTFPVLQTEEKGQGIDPIGTKILSELHNKVLKACSEHTDGYFQKQLFVAAGLDADMCALAAKYEFARKVPVPMRPGLTQVQRDELRTQGAINAQVGTLGEFWGLLGRALSPEAEALCGRLELKTHHTAQGTERLLVLRLRRDFSKLVRRLPVLMLDATFPGVIMKHFASNIRPLAEIRVAAPFMRVTAIIGGGFGKIEQEALLAPDADASKRRRLARQQAFVRGFGFGARALAITYKAATKGYEGLEGVEVAHFGAVAGRDEWGPQEGKGGIKTLFVIGRQMPSPPSVRDLTVALTGKAIAPLVPTSVVKVPRTRNGHAQPVSVFEYSDPDSEAIRWAICEGEVIQAIGRARGVSRTASNPVSVFLLANVVLPLNIDSVVRWENVAPRTVEALLLRGILPLSGQDAALLAPDLFPSAEGAEVAGRAIREAFGDVKYSCKPEFTNISCINTLYKEKVGEFRWLTIAYRRQGRGHRTTQMLVRADLLDGLRDRLTERLGPLAKFEVLPSSDRSVPFEITQFTYEADPQRPAGRPPLPQIESASAQQQSTPAEPESAPAPWLDIDLGPDGVSGTVVVLGHTPPLPGERLTPQPPPVSPQPLKLVQPDELTRARERLLAADAALEAVRPPHLWGDEFDGLRIENWRKRCAAARAKRESEVLAWRVDV